MTCLNSLSSRAHWAALALTGLLAACGGGGGDSVTVTPSTAPVTQTPIAVVPTPSGTVTPAVPVMGASCEKTNPRVGQVATLSMLAHGVSGKATVVDNCTIEIRNFNYDGGGLSKVFVYGGKASNYVAGFPIGNNLRGTSFANQTLTVTLNMGDLDKLDGISIWCADANANFGAGLFAPV